MPVTALPELPGPTALPTTQASPKPRPNRLHALWDVAETLGVWTSRSDSAPGAPSPHDAPRAPAAAPPPQRAAPSPPASSPQPWRSGPAWSDDTLPDSPRPQTPELCDLPPGCVDVAALWRPVPQVYFAIKPQGLRLGYRGLKPWADFRFSNLFLGQGAVDLVLSHSVAQGGQGKVRMAFAPQGAVYAVKECRWYDKPGVSPISGRSYTYAHKHQDFVDEMELTAYARGIIDAELIRTSAVGAPGAQAAGRTRTRTAPMQVFALGYNPNLKKSYSIMTLMAGDLHRCCGEGTLEARARLAESFAVQGMEELRILHERALLAHFDVRPSNALFHDDGQIVLSDFGHAQPVDARGLSSVRGPYGSILAPEMLGLGDRHCTGYLPKLTTAVDIFALAISVANLMTEPGAPMPFQNVDPSADTPEAYAASRRRASARMQTYCRWHAQLQPHVGLEGLQGDNPLDAFFMPLKRARPKLCQLLLAQALDPNAKTRSTAAQLLPNLRQALIAGGPPLERHTTSLHDPRLVLAKASNRKAIEVLGEVAHVHHLWAKGDLQSWPLSPPSSHPSDEDVAHGARAPDEGAAS